jgi:hypothetical protein
MGHRSHRFAATFVVGLAASANGYAQANQPPDITLPSSVTTQPGTVAQFAPVVSDPDVGNGLMELEIDVSDLDGVGGLSVANGDYGRFTWGFGSNVTTDVELRTRSALNSALSSFTYLPRTGFAGLARIIFEIDDQGNTGTGGTLSRTRFINIDVCTPAELGTAACATNAQPDITLPSTRTVQAGQSVTFAPGVSDVDVGAGVMELEIDISDLDGAGGLSVPNGDYGRFTWGFGTAVTSDIATTTLANMNTALMNFTYIPAPGFTGMARIVFEIDDQGNSGTALGNVLSRTRFIDINVVSGVARITNRCPIALGEGALINVNVERAAGNVGAASVQLQAVNGSAVLNSDFLFTNSVLSWAAGQSGNRSANLQILSDGASEPVETFTLRIVSPFGVALDTPSVVPVYIYDAGAAEFIHGNGFDENCGS